MKSQTGAAYVAHVNNGGASVRRFADPADPSIARWKETVAIMSAALAAIGRTDERVSAGIASTALARAAEAVPDITRSVEVRAAVATGANLAEQKLSAPAKSDPSPRSDPHIAEQLAAMAAKIDAIAGPKLARTKRKAASALQPGLFDDESAVDCLPAERQAAAAELLSRIEALEKQAVAPSQPQYAPGTTTRPLTIPELVQRLKDLGQRKDQAKRRGNTSNAGSIGVKMT